MDKPYIGPNEKVPEITLRAIFLGIILTVILGASNSYLALKAGQTVTACIPAAVISMMLLRKRKCHGAFQSTILENNMVQTIASAGEAIAAGIVFTLPSLLVMGFWKDFHFLETSAIGIIGGILGVFFSVPLRQAFVVTSKLRFPEGVATTEVLKSGEKETKGLKELFLGSFLSATFKLCETGFKVVLDAVSFWLTTSTGTTMGIGSGLSFAMIGAGYVIGWRSCVAVVMGTLITWVIGIPMYSLMFGSPEGLSGFDAAMSIWSEKMRFIGVGAFVIGGFWTIFGILPQIKEGIIQSFKGMSSHHEGTLRTDKDIPMKTIIGGTIVSIIPLGLFFHKILIMSEMSFNMLTMITLITFATLFSLIIGFLSSCISSYTTGVVGSSQNPLSGIVIMAVLIVSSVFYVSFDQGELQSHGLSIAGIVMVIASIVACIACIGGENMQDLKSGYLLGSTPWKQQSMLFIGVIVGSLTIAPVLQILYEAYGLVGAMPRPDMDVCHAMSAPKAILMAEIIKSVFSQTLNWGLYIIGAAIAVCVIIVDHILKIKNCSIRLPILSVAIGIYLPFDVGTAAFIGGLLSYYAHRRMVKQKATTEEIDRGDRRGLLFASGLIAGEALIGVMLAVPFAICQNNDLFRWAMIADLPIIVHALTIGSALLLLRHFLRCASDFKK
jgi:putative OPT family oligopeptide transporter